MQKESLRMYRLVIADDEFLVRNGLISCVNWNALGFEIMGQFEDGEDVIAYVSENPVDVIFTDVKMFYVSGIDVAQWVIANQPTVKVVFVSGYKEFDYVKKAMELDVCDYVLKPIDIAEIMRVFSKIKRELDQVTSLSISSEQEKISANMLQVSDEQKTQMDSASVNNGIAVSEDYIIEHARAYVEQHLSKDFALDDVAGHLYLSKSQSVPI